MRTADGDSDERTARDLEALDHPMRLPDVEALIVRGRARAARRRRRRLRLIAAAAAFIATVSAAAIIPSPMRDLVRGTLARAHRQAARPAPQAAEEAAPASPPSGIAFTPRGAVEVSFHRPQDAGVLRVTLIDSGDVRVMNSGANAVYSVTSNGVSIENDGSGGAYEVRLPRTLARGTIRVAGRAVFVLDSTGVHAAVAPDESGVYHLSLAARR